MCMLFPFQGYTIHKLFVKRKRIEELPNPSSTQKERAQAIDMAESLLGLGRKFHLRSPTRRGAGGGVSALLSISFCP